MTTEEELVRLKKSNLALLKRLALQGERYVMYREPLGLWVQSTAASVEDIPLGFERAYFVKQI